MPPRSEQQRWFRTREPPSHRALTCRRCHGPPTAQSLFPRRSPCPVPAAARPCALAGRVCVTPAACRHHMFVSRMTNDCLLWSWGEWKQATLNSYTLSSPWVHACAVPCRAVQCSAVRCAEPSAVLCCPPPLCCHIGQTPRCRVARPCLRYLCNQRAATTSVGTRFQI